MTFDPPDRFDPSEPDEPAEELAFRVEPAEDAEEDPLARLRSDAQERGEKEDARRSFWRELPVLIVVALFVAILIKTFLVQAFFIPSASMRDTLLEGDRVMVNKLAYRLGEPAHSDVIVFDSPLDGEGGGENFLQAIVRNVAESLGLSSPDSALIKRVIAVGGERLEIRDNTVFVDGEALVEPYVRAGSRMSDFGPITVPDGHVFVMGDNRSASQDSRRFGAVPVGDIVGKAFVRVWPPSRWGGL
ncbi:MAG: signal peptidase I [Acidimicrobiia bacterium]|nr:signal peptidase I [Acidimicrobiia bacterium]